jgi:hypothetical protein
LHENGNIVLLEKITEAGYKKRKSLLHAQLQLVLQRHKQAGTSASGLNIILDYNIEN